MEPDPPDGHHHGTTVATEAPPAGPDQHHREMAAASPGGHIGHAAPAEGALRSPHEMMGHGGHGGMSMEAMVADMRNRFLVAALFSIPILLWSPIGREVLGFELAAPFGLRDDVWSLLLSLPVIFYSCWIFFDGAVRALRARTLDMMVLVAVAVGAGWLLLGGRHPDRRRRGLLRGGQRPGRVRAVGPLVRDARPRWGQ